MKNNHTSGPLPLKVVLVEIDKTSKAFDSSVSVIIADGSLVFAP